MAGQAAGATIRDADMYAWDHEAVMKMARAANCVKAAAATTHGKLWIDGCPSEYSMHVDPDILFIRAPREVTGGCKEWADLMLLLCPNNDCPCECILYWALFKDLQALLQQQECTIFCNDVASKLGRVCNLLLDVNSGRLVRTTACIWVAKINYVIEVGMRSTRSIDLEMAYADAWRLHFTEEVQNCNKKALAFCMGAHGRLGEVRTAYAIAMSNAYKHILIW